jgi:acetamidase/formamidase
VDPGDSVRFSTLDAFWFAGPSIGGSLDGRPRSEHHREGYGHALVGPIAVRGAEPGMVLEVRVDAIVPGRWGTTVAGGWPSVFNQRYGEVEGRAGHAWDLDPVAMTGRNQFGHTVALRPFLGVMGMPPAEPGEHSTTPPRSHGGNLDCKELVAGSTLYLPIPVAGGLFSAGDGHAAQGDGEVDQTAIETSLRGRVKLTVRKGMTLKWPRAETPTHFISMGTDVDLTQATRVAIQEMIDFIVSTKGLDKHAAYQLTSIAGDVAITQLVDGTMGVHVKLPKEIFR